MVSLRNAKSWIGVFLRANIIHVRKYIIICSQTYSSVRFFFMVSSVRWLCVMDFFRRSGSWHSVLSPVACLRPCATPSVVLVGKPNKLRNCFYVVVARLFFSPISFTAWCTIQIAMLKQGKGFCRDKSEQSGLGRTGIALTVLQYPLWKSFSPMKPRAAC